MPDKKPKPSPPTTTGSTDKRGQAGYVPPKPPVTKERPKPKG